MKFKLMLRSVAMASAVASLVACGGLDTAPGNASNTLNINGVVAKGAPIANATVNISCKNGVKGTTTTKSNGTYTVDLPGAVGPCLVEANGLKGITYGGSGNLVANLNAFTTSIVSALGSGALNANNTQIAAANDAALATINEQLKAKGQPTIPAGTNLVAGDYTADPNADPVDAALEDATTLGLVDGTTGEPTDAFESTVNHAVDDVVDPSSVPTGATN